MTAIPPPECVAGTHHADDWSGVTRPLRHLTPESQTMTESDGNHTSAELCVSCYGLGWVVDALAPELQVVCPECDKPDPITAKTEDGAAADRCDGGQVVEERSQ